MVEFAEKVEKACIDTVDKDKIMTKDLALACGLTDRKSWVTTDDYLDAVEARLQKEIKKR